MKISFPLFLLLIFLAIMSISKVVHGNPSLGIMVKTDKQQYNPTEIVHVNGNLTLDGVLVTDGLVGIEVRTSSVSIVLRTLPAFHIPSETPYILTEYVAPCDQSGNPKFSFQRGTSAYFKVSLGNLDYHQPHQVLVTVNIYDSSNTPLGSAGFKTTLQENSTSLIILSVPVPSDSVVGTATVFASAYTDWPSLGGTPYCREVNATFQITSGALVISQPAQAKSTNVQSIGTNYNLTFKLAARTPSGNYTVYATSSYQGQTALNFTTFKVSKVGDLGSGVPPQFFLFDGKCDGKDLALFLRCYHGTAPLEAMYLGDLGSGIPPQFFLFDGKCDGKDLALFLLCFRGQGPN
jgi:hypothetical protein